MSQRFKADRLPRQPGQTAWNCLLPEQPPARILDAEVKADIAIIGAGFTGLSAARRLLQLDPALKVVVLEAGRVADGPAGRNSGFMIDLPHDLSSDDYSGAGSQGVAAEKDRVETSLNRAAIAFAADAAEQYGMSEEAFDPCGKFNAAATPAGDQHNRDYGQHLASMGEAYQLLDAEDMQKLTGTDYYSSGLYTPGTAMLQPAAYIRCLASGMQNEVTVYENSPVTELLSAGNDWKLKSPSGSVIAPRVILANNGHAESFGFFKHQLIHVFTYASMTEPLPAGALGGEAKWSATPADPMGTTVRRLSGNMGDRILIRSRFTYNPSMAVSDAAVQRAGKVHDQKFASRFPMLKGVDMAYRWAGHLCLSWNGVPIQSEVAPGVFAAVCQNGLGVAKGTVSGMAAAERALGQQSEITRAFAAMPPPRKLPIKPVAWLGINAQLKWKEWRAGRE